MGTGTYFVKYFLRLLWMDASGSRIYLVPLKNTSSALDDFFTILNNRNNNNNNSIHHPKKKTTKTATVMISKSLRDTRLPERTNKRVE